MKRKQGKVDEAKVLNASAENQVLIRPLGAGQEVGRSCFLLRYQGKGVMFDCGIHPAHTGMSSLPMMDNQSLSNINVALITHFHLDHCAALPYLVGNTDFKGQIFMTHATKNIFYTMMRDILRMHRKDPSRYLFSPEDLEATMSRISVINFHQTITVDGIQITPYRAGHVLGAAMFMTDILGMRCLYTGDYSRVPDRHMPAADLPAVPPNIVIVESTFGTSNHLPREDRERSFQNKVREIVAQGGRCLIPVVALGRAQELLLILEDCWSRHPELRHVPIYQTSGIATQSLSVYQSYIEMMNDSMRAVFKQRNPFEFRHVRHVLGFRADSEFGPCVVLATPSMLQTGLSRELFEAWCEDARNGVIIADFAVQGTLARELLTNPREVMGLDGRTLKVRCSVSAFSFSAHADYSQTSEFIRTLAPAHVVLCHGNINEMDRLKHGLQRQAEDAGAERSIHTPANLTDICIPFDPRRMVHVVGSAAEVPPKIGEKVQGVTVQRKTAGGLRVMEPKDLGVYNKVSVGKIIQRQHMTLRTSFAKCRLALEVMFEGIDAQQALGGVESVNGAALDAETGVTVLLEELLCFAGRAGWQFAEPDDNVAEQIMVADMIKVVHVAARDGDKDNVYGKVILEWASGPLSDCVADSVVSILLQEQGPPAAIGAVEQERKHAIAAGDTKAVEAADKFIALELLKQQFGSAEVEKSGLIRVEIPGSGVVINWEMDHVTTDPEDPALKARVMTCLSRLRQALARVDPREAATSQDTGTIVTPE